MVIMHDLEIIEDNRGRARSGGGRKEQGEGLLLMKKEEGDPTPQAEVRR